MSKTKERLEINQSLSLQQMEDLLYRTDSVDDLYKLQVELSKKLSSLHKHIHQIDKNDESKRNITRSDISWATELKDVCEKRQGLLISESNKFNRNFRLAAEKKLTKQLYDQICDEAKNNQ